VIADRVAVMRAGRMIEQGTVEQIFSQPAHSYTRELLDAIPVPIPRSLRR
jgi:ABC-type dipeptide/oligopeptide/nickel transport system ATPase component